MFCFIFNLPSMLPHNILEKKKCANALQGRQLMENPMSVLVYCFSPFNELILNFNFFLCAIYSLSSTMKNCSNQNTIISIYIHKSTWLGKALLYIIFFFLYIFAYSVLSFENHVKWNWKDSNHYTRFQIRKSQRAFVSTAFKSKPFPPFYLHSGILIIEKRDKT